MSEPDFYAILDVSRDCSADELKSAYRRLARELHPDLNPGDAAAEARFKEVSVAYEVLSDPEKRANYDRYGTAGMGGMGDPFAGAGLGDIFEAFFGGGSPFGGGGRRGPTGPPRGADLEVVVDLDFEEAVFGVQKPVEVRTATACVTCEATGAEPGSAPITCPQCQGAGQVQRVRQSVLGRMVTSSPCDRCSGMGQVIERRCPDCNGEGRRIEERTLTVDIVPGVDNGSVLRITGRGAAGPRGGATGDLYVHTRVKPHERFERHDLDLLHTLHVPFTQAALGTHIEFETLDGTEDLKLEPGTPSGHVLRLRGRGVPNPQRKGRGDLIVQVHVDVPTDLTDEQEELLRKFAALRDEQVAPAEHGFFSKIRSAFQ